MEGRKHGDLVNDRDALKDLKAETWWFVMVDFVEFDSGLWLVLCPILTCPEEVGRQSKK